MIPSKEFIKLAGSWDTQPGFMDRDMGNSALGYFSWTADEDGERKRRKKMKRIYQLGITVPLTEKELRQPLLTL